MAVTHEVRVKLKEMEALKEIKNKMNDRQKCNKEILKVIEKLVDENSALRFCQILSILDLDKDNFNEEPIDTLKRINDKLVTL